MQSIDQIVNRTDLTVAQPAATPEGELNEFARQHINSIFKRLAHTFPTFKTAYRTDAERDEVKRVWVKGLVEGGITSVEQIARGMAKARTANTPFFPSIGQFIAWCKPDAADLGMPSPEAAWLEANNHSHHVNDHEWSHPAVYAAGKHQFFHIRAGDYSRDKYIADYEQLMALVAAGHVIEGPVTDNTKLEYQSGAKTTTEEAKAVAASALADLKKGFGL